MVNTIGKLTLVSMLLALGLQATAQTYVAIAVDENNDWAWARNSTEVDAQLAALKICEEDGVHTCSIAYQTGFVIAKSKSESKVGYGMSDDPIYKIHDGVLKVCAKDDCVIEESITEPGFIAIAISSEPPIAIGWDSGHYDPDAARESALKSCNELKINGVCKVTRVGAIRGNLDASKAIKNTSASTQPQSCRPTTNPIRCTSNCVNGNCKVTYENGCVIEVTVQPKYDPFNNAWTYPSPQC